MYSDNYAENLSMEERQLSEIAIKKRRSRQRLIFVGMALLISVILILFAGFIISCISDGAVKDIAEQNLETGGRGSGNTDGLIGFTSEVFWFFILALAALVLLVVNIKLNYNLLRSLDVTEVRRCTIVSLKMRANKKYPYMLTVKEKDRTYEKDIVINNETYEMIRDSKDVVVIYYPDLKLFDSDRKREYSTAIYCMVPKTDYFYEFIQADF